MSIQSNTTIMIIEDEPKIAQLIVDYLHVDNFATVWLQDGTNVRATIELQCPALIVLDVMLPGLDGFALCEEIRKFSQIPIIMLTARSQEHDRLNGFESGADDYICKPFSPKELIFRIKAILKRASIPLKLNAAQRPLIELNLAAYTATVKGKALDLTPIEFAILSALAQSPGRVFSRNELLDRAYSGHHIINDRTIDSHIKNLRRKLKSVAPEEDIVQSIYGLGYKAEIYR